MLFIFFVVVFVITLLFAKDYGSVDIIMNNCLTEMTQVNNNLYIGYYETIPPDTCNKYSSNIYTIHYGNSTKGSILQANINWQYTTYDGNDQGTIHLYNMVRHYQLVFSCTYVVFFFFPKILHKISLLHS